MRTYEPLSQNDSRWKDILLGNSATYTLGQAGCYVTSFAVLSYYYGVPLSPTDINQKLKDAGLFSGGLISADDDLEKILPSIKYVKSLNYPGPADLQILKDLLSDPSTSVIVEIDLGNKEVHFTPVIACDGTNVTILNVWDGHVADLKSVYGDPATVILKYVVYSGTPAVVTAPDTILEIKQGDFLKLMQKSEELDKIGAGMSFTQIEVDTLGFSSKVLQKYQEAQNSAASIPTPESAPVSNSAPDQPITNKQFALLQSFLSLIGLKLESK
jgi:hypothetical protein